MSTVLKRLPKSEVEMSGVLTPQEYEAERPRVLKELQKEVKIDGFRHGHIPEKVLIEKVGEEYILDESVEHALKNLYPELISEHGIFPLGTPTTSLGGKVVAGEPINYTVRTAVLPSITLPDYKALAATTAREDTVAVEEKDVEAILADLQRLVTKQIGGETSDLPVLDDDFARSFGSFQTIAELKDKLRDNLVLEREKETRDKFRLSLLEVVVKETKVELPDVLIEGEQNRMQAELENSIARAGIEWKDYLEQNKKTEEELRGEWKEVAQKRALGNLVLREIGKIESLDPTDEEVERETSKLLREYENADPDRARTYVEEVLFNNKVFAWLESQSEN